MKVKSRSGYDSGRTIKLLLGELREFSQKRIDEWAATGNEVLALLDEIKRLKRKNRQLAKQLRIAELL